MTGQWYWRNKYGEFGPLTTDEVVKAIGEDLVRETDHFRLVETEDWLPARDVKRMVVEAQGTTVEDSTSAAAHVRPDAAPPRRAEEQSATSDRHRSSREVAAAGKWQKADLLALTGVIAAWTMIGIVLVVVCAKATEAILGDAGTTYDRLRSTYEVLRSPEWQEATRAQVSERELAWLTPCIDELEKSLHRRSMFVDYWVPFVRDRAVQRHLLDAGRSLRRMLTSGDMEDAVFRRSMEAAVSRLNSPWRDPWIIGAVLGNILLCVIGYLVQRRVRHAGT